MDFDQVARQMSAQTYQYLKSAVEIGRWADGKLMDPQQRQISLEAILRYEFEHLPPEQRSGYIPPKSTSACHSDSNPISENDAQTLRWQN